MNQNSSNLNRRKITAPPRGFKLTKEVLWARWLLEPPPFLKKKRKCAKGAKRNGQKYEECAQKYLTEVYGNNYIPGPWFKFFDKGTEQLKWCQPDGLLIDVKRGLITIVEIKLKHTSRAWWQLEKKYLPVLKHIFGEDFKFAMVEMVKWYDCAETFPCEVTLRPHIHDARPTHFQVTIWRPRKS